MKQAEQVRRALHRVSDSAKAASQRSVLFVVNVPWFFKSHRAHLITAARNAGYDVHIAALDDGTEADLIALGATFHPVPFSRVGMQPVKEVRLLIALYRLYRRLAPDVVHHITIKPMLYGTAAARWARVPTVVNAVSGLGYFYSAMAKKTVGGYARVVRLFVRHPRRHFIFQNADDKDDFVAMKIAREGECSVIPGSADPSRFYPGPSPSGPPIVILPARMLVDKGVGEFVSAARQLKSRGVSARFALVGGRDENPASVTQEFLDQAVAEGSIEWWGHQKDMANVYRMAAVVALPSYREGMPKVLIEAAASRAAIVTTDVPGCRDVVANGECGLVVRPRDGAALADAIGALLANEELRVRLGEAAYRRFQELYTDEHVARQTIALYERVSRPS